MRVGLISTDEVFLRADPDNDMAAICAGLGAAGIDRHILNWHTAQDWSGYDALVFRSPWDYPEHMAEFEQWLAATEPVARVLNPPNLVRWNLDKRYLAELAACGVRCTPTTYCDQVATCVSALADIDGDMVVVKPNISVGSRNTGLFNASDPAALALCEQILALGKTVLIQRAIPEIQNNAEHALLYFNGRFSHAICKGAILVPGGGYIGGTYTENISPAEASEEEIALGSAALGAIGSIAASRHWGPDAEVPLQVRIDVVTPAGGPPMLLEAELFEPALFLAHSPGAADRFVTAVMEKLQPPDPRPGN